MLRYLAVLVPAGLAIGTLVLQWDAFGDVLAALLLITTVLAFVAAGTTQPKVKRAVVLSLLSAGIVLLVTATWNAIWYFVPLAVLVAVAVTPRQHPAQV